MDDLRRAEVKQSGPLPVKKELVGYGGWLILFSIGMAIQFFSLFVALIRNYEWYISDDFKRLSDINSSSYNALWEPAMIYEMGIEIISMCLLLLMAFFLIKMDYKFKVISLIYIPTSFVLMSIDALLLLNIQNYYDEPLNIESVNNSVISTFAYMVVWVPYFLVSRRVKNTFVKKIAP